MGARFVRSAVAHQEGDDEAAAAGLTKAIAEFDSQGMRLYAAGCRGRLGQLIGGDAGRGHQRAAAQWMATQDIRDPTAMTCLIAPGFRPRR